MIGKRTRLSLVQFLALQEPALAVLLLSKHGAQHVSLMVAEPLSDLSHILQTLDEPILMRVFAEIVATPGDLRARVNPKYRFDERLHDLTQCLLLDGYLVQDKRLIQTDPSIADAMPIDDDLIVALLNSDTPRRQDIIRKINASAESFRATPPDYNASLVNARVALETLAVDVATDVATRLPNPATYDPSSWGSVIAFLRISDEISVEEEKGLAGVFRFLSPGAHRPIGVPEDQMTRLGRSFALNMCWFLLRNHLAKIGQG
ncbi:hypothetical protein PQR66_09405 [Paraburkholderia agricolaris]|uniref:Uncharacterized protein n=1 Tax=Paraburkholderia agricolaris TaxID=2152888 RepID=A0ABW8ZJU7_9BURK